MSASQRMGVGVVAAGLSCLLLTIATAAEINPTTGQNDSSRTGQIDRAQVPQTGQRVLRGQPYTAGYRGAQAGAQPGQEVERYLANCLLNNNKAEVELSQFAVRQSQNPQVKQFAEELTKDHRQLAQQLEQIVGILAAAHRAGSSPNANTAPGTDRTTIDATGGRPITSAFDPAAPNAVTPSATNELSRDTSDGTSAAHPAMHGNAALHQLAGIEQKIDERCLQALREELQQKSGAEFDECFVGSQIAGHMHMLAALEVISQETKGPLKQASGEARPTVQKHLNQAKQLAMQLQASGKRSAQAQRTSTSTETQR